MFLWTVGWMQSFLVRHIEARQQIPDDGQGLKYGNFESRKLCSGEAVRSWRKCINASHSDEDIFGS